jgi:hypothetical protein
MVALPTPTKELKRIQRRLRYLDEIHYQKGNIVTCLLDNGEVTLRINAQDHIEIVVP